MEYVGSPDAMSEMLRRHREDMTMLVAGPTAVEHAAESSGEKVVEPFRPEAYMPENPWPCAKRDSYPETL